VITVDGEAVNPGDGSGEDAAAKEVRAARLELRLCKALAALSPPRDVALLAHARAADLLRVLRKQDAADPEAVPVADLSDAELKEAAGIVRAFCALPPGSIRGFPGGISFRSVLGEYALELAAELDSRVAGSEADCPRST
jgi:hypothetical protein